MHRRVEEAIDHIDAAVFSGDAFSEEAPRKEFSQTLARWTRGIAPISEDQPTETSKPCIHDDFQPCPLCEQVACVLMCIGHPEGCVDLFRLVCIRCNFATDWMEADELKNKLLEKYPQEASEATELPHNIVILLRAIRGRLEYMQRAGKVLAVRGRPEVDQFLNEWLHDGCGLTELLEKYPETPTEGNPESD